MDIRDDNSAGPDHITWARHDAPGVTRLVPKGTVDEHFRTGAPLEDLPAHVLLDLEGVRRITSFGIREWMKLLEGFDVRYHGFVHCRPAIVTQFNLVYNFGVGGEILSLYLPYYCEECDEDFEILADLREARSLFNFDIPQASCPSCTAPAELDDMPEHYLAHLAKQGPPSPPPAVLEAIGGEAVAPKAPPTLVKEVSENVTALWLGGSFDRRARFKRALDGVEGQIVVVAADVEGVDEVGMRNFETFIDRQAWLARVPLPVFERIWAEERLRELAQFISVRVPAWCDGCKWECQVDIPLEELERAEVDRVDGTCKICDGGLTKQVVSEPLSPHGPLPLTIVPTDIDLYLERHPLGPGDSQAGRDTVRGTSFGRYELMDLIGVGGMAEIFLAKQSGAENFERKVVIKRLLPQFKSNVSVTDMFIQEARLAARLSHPNIVQIQDFGETNEFYYIAMEYVDGWDLRKVLRHADVFGTPLPFAMCCFIVAQICEGLHAAHTYRDDRGEMVPVIHMDVSPRNILLSRYGDVKLTDFGIARLASQLESEAQQKLTGTAAYVSPERLRQEIGPVDGRADVFSAGAILFECLTHRSLFRRRTVDETLRAVMGESVPPVSEIRRDVPPELQPILERALTKSPHKRYPTARAFQHALEDLLKTQGYAVTHRDLREFIDQIADRELPPDIDLERTSSAPSVSELNTVIQIPSTEP